MVAWHQPHPWHTRPRPVRPLLGQDGRAFLQHRVQIYCLAHKQLVASPVRALLGQDAQTRIFCLAAKSTCCVFPRIAFAPILKSQGFTCCGSTRKRDRDRDPSVGCTVTSNLLLTVTGHGTLTWLARKGTNRCTQVFVLVNQPVATVASWYGSQECVSLSLLYD